MLNFDDYFNEDGDFYDEEGTVDERLESIRFQSRRECTRGKYLAKQALGGVMIETSKLVIINDVDKPCHQLLAKDLGNGKEDFLFTY